MLTDDHGTDARVASPPFGAALRVLASGSSGNCSVLILRTPHARRVALIDLGLSPRRTGETLAAIGLSLEDDVQDVFLTHLDGDHCHAGWGQAFPQRATLRLHRRHMRRAADAGLPIRQSEPFDEPFEPATGIVVSPILLSHDRLGVAAFRFDVGGVSLGYATDFGRVAETLIRHLTGVDLLAIESNYCPRLQTASSRPTFLKNRIMGGSGHISNEECLSATQRIAPREHAVFLHLSEECNRPSLVADLHRGAPYTVTVAPRHRPTRWIRATGDAASPESRIATAAASSLRPVPANLFG